MNSQNQFKISSFLNQRVPAPLGLLIVFFVFVVCAEILIEQQRLLQGEINELNEALERNANLSELSLNNPAEYDSVFII